MTGFDETVPPDPDLDDGTAAPADPPEQRPGETPEHDSTAPAFEDDPQPDEPPAQR